MSEVASQVNIEKALSIGGWMSERELIWLAIQAQSHDRIVEFGSFHGRSTRALADNCNGKIWAVDPWNGTYILENGSELSGFTTFVLPYFKYNLNDHIRSGRVMPVRGFSYNFNLDQKVDMVFIDGDHKYETVVKDIKKAYELLKSDGLICGHDFGHPEWPGVKKAVEELVPNYQLAGESIWYAIRY